MTDDFIKRASQYWEDLEGIIKLLNDAHPRYNIDKIDSRIITNYLLWRILTEQKVATEINFKKVIKEIEKFRKELKEKNG